MDKSKIKHSFYLIFGLLLLTGLIIVFGMIYPIFLVYTYSLNFAIVIFLSIFGLSLFLIYYGIGGLRWNIRKDSNPETIRLPKNFYLNLGVYSLFLTILITWFNLIFFLFDFYAIHDDIGYVLTHMLIVVIIGVNFLFGMTSVLALRYHRKLTISTKKNSDEGKREKSDSGIFKLRKIQSRFLIGIFISMGITGAFTFLLYPDCYMGQMGFSDPAYNLPSGSHYNTAPWL